MTYRQYHSMISIMKGCFLATNTCHYDAPRYKKALNLMNLCWRHSCKEWSIPIKARARTITEQQKRDFADYKSVRPTREERKYQVPKYDLARIGVACG